MSETFKKTEQKEAIVKMGEWFNPFVNYRDLPLIRKIDDWESKKVTIEIINLGRLTFSLTRSSSHYQRLCESEFVNPVKYLVVSAQGEKLVSSNDVIQEEAVLQVRLFLLFGPSAEKEAMESSIFERLPENYDVLWRNKKSPYVIEIRLPTGQTLTGPLGKDSHTPKGEFILPPSDWNFNDKKIGQILISEDKDLLEKIQMRIVPIGGEKPQVSRQTRLPR